MTPVDEAISRKLDEAERALWDEVTRLLKPLRARSVPPGTRAPKPLRAAPREHARANSVLAPLETLDRRAKKRLAHGTVPLDARLDLHGKTQAQAYSSLRRFLNRAHKDGAKFALVITGKGTTRSEGGWESGVLRRQVPQWLTQPEFRAYVSAYEAAGPAHGGEGALYIRIRRARYRSVD
jgi:DNA-nicking Smr family endonuclease